MRKILFSVAALFAFGAANAQDAGGFSLGAHVGIPMGDVKDYSGLNYGIDAAYMWPVMENFGLGIASGYTMFSGKDFENTLVGPDGQIIRTSVKGDGFGFIPLAAAGKYMLTENLFLGVDLGYAFYVGDGNGDGGLYYQPKLGYDFKPFEMFISYKGIEDNSSINAVGLGVAYKFY